MVPETTTGIPEGVIMNKIYLIRGENVMLDRDLAELYGVETKVLKQSVRRKISRFPPDFMFELTKEELDNWRYQFGTSNKEIMGLRVPPFAFTEQLEQAKQQELGQQKRKRIGYRRNDQ